MTGKALAKCKAITTVERGVGGRTYCKQSGVKCFARILAVEVIASQHW